VIGERKSNLKEKPPVFAAGVGLVYLKERGES